MFIELISMMAVSSFGIFCGLVIINSMTANSQSIVAQNGTITMAIPGATLTLATETAANGPASFMTFASQEDIKNALITLQPQV